METIVIKRKEFEVLENIGEDCFKISRKGKIFFAKKFEPKSDAFNDYIYASTRIKSALVNAPRIKLIDKKNGYIVSEYFEGQTVLEYLVNNEPEEDNIIYKDIFMATKLARANGMVLDCKPDHWIITDKGLAYMKKTFDIYSKEKDFTQTDIRLWFITKDLARYAKEHGYDFDNKRLKDEYLTNKHIVLVTCKLYQ